MDPYLISPPDTRPHGVWYVAGVKGIAVGVTYDQAMMRYRLR